MGLFKKEIAPSNTAPLTFNNLEIYHLNAPDEEPFDPLQFIPTISSSFSPLPEPPPSETYETNSVRSSSGRKRIMSLFRISTLVVYV